MNVEHSLIRVRQSDHPIMNSRYLAYEAQQAHYFGFPHNLALASVTSTPAKVMGIDHRVGYVKEGALRTIAVEKLIFILDMVQDTTPVSVTMRLARSCRFINLRRSRSLGQPPPCTRRDPAAGLDRRDRPDRRSAPALEAGGIPKTSAHSELR